MKILNNNNQTNLQNKLLNSMLKIVFIEKNNDICNLLFNKFSLFKNPDDYRHIISLSYSKILLKFNNIKDNKQFREMMSEILSKFTFIEMLNCLNDLNKQLFTNYESYDYFLDLLIDNFGKLKPLESFINKQIFEVIKKFIEIKKYNKEQLLKNKKFIEIIFKSIIIFLNTEGKYNSKDDNNIFYVIKELINLINDNIFLIYILKILFLELYSFSELKDKKNEIFLKLEFLNNSSFENFSELKIKQLDINLFDYLGNIIKLFTSFSPDMQIINYFLNYLNDSFCIFYQIYLVEYDNLVKKSIKLTNNYFYLCNFFHLYQSKKICYRLYYYLIDYHKNNNKVKFFKQFEILYACLINIFKLCPHPFYFDIIIDIFKDSNSYDNNKIYSNDLIEMIAGIELGKENNSKYQNYFYNIILIIKIFFYFSKQANIFNDQILCMHIFEILKKIKKIKKHLLIFSNYLTKLDENDNINKTILELCYIIFISIFNTPQNNNKLLNKFCNLFLDENIKNDNSNKLGKSIMFVLDSNNNLLNYKYKKEIKLDDYDNYEFEVFISVTKDNKKEEEEKSIIIKLILYINILKNYNYTDFLSNLII